MSKSQFTIAQMSLAFVALPETIAEILHFGGFSPCDHGIDGCSPHYDATAATYVVERLPAQQALSAVAEIATMAAEQKQIFRAKLIPSEPSMKGTTSCD